MIIFANIFGLFGVLYAGPATDILALIVSVIFVSWEWRKMSGTGKTTVSQN